MSGPKKPVSQSWISWAYGKFAVVKDFAEQWGYGGYVAGRYIGWILMTTGIVTFLPLLFELKREMAIEDMERMQVEAAIAGGRTPQELASQGLTSAVAPAVLN